MKSSFVKAILAFVLCLFAVSAMASMSDEMSNKFSDLTAQQQADMYKQVTDQIAKNNQDKSQAKQEEKAQEQAATIDKVSEYTQLGNSIGAALAGTARELGVVANDFLKTPVGMIAATLIVWKIAGGAIIHVFGGIAFMIVFFPVWYIAFKRHCLVHSTTTSTDEKGKKVVTVSAPKDGSDNAIGYWVLFIVGVIITNIIVFTY